MLCVAALLRIDANPGKRPRDIGALLDPDLSKKIRQTSIRVRNKKKGGPKAASATDESGLTGAVDMGSTIGAFARWTLRTARPTAHVTLPRDLLCLLALLVSKAARKDVHRLNIRLVTICGRGWMQQPIHRPQRIRWLLPLRLTPHWRRQSRKAEVQKALTDRTTCKLR